jgi:HSP20 family molecular chaperone IbpA
MIQDIPHTASVDTERDAVENEDIKASMTNGILSVVFSKSTHEAVPKKVTIA